MCRSQATASMYPVTPVRRPAKPFIPRVTKQRHSITPTGKCCRTCASWPKRREEMCIPTLPRRPLGLRTRPRQWGVAPAREHREPLVPVTNPAATRSERALEPVLRDGKLVNVPTRSGKMMGKVQRLWTSDVKRGT